MPIDTIITLYSHSEKRMIKNYEILLSPYIDQKKKADADTLFLRPEDYAKMTPEERAEKQKKMDIRWGQQFK